MAWWQPLALALLLGALAGFVEVAVVFYRREVAHEFTWTSRDLVWMSPLGNTAFLLAPAALLTGLRLLRPAWCSWAMAVGILGFGAALSAVLNVRGLHPLAVLFLAAGLAVQGGRAAGRRSVPLARGVPRLAAAAVAVTALAFTASSRERGPATGGTAPAGAPNVLLLILDTVRAASTSLHGYTRPTTPALERLAREGIRFDWAIAPSSWTLPSHAAMFTGRPASTLSASWRRPLDATFPTLAEELAARGYRTGAFVANLFYTHHESGVDRGFQVLRDFRRSRLQVLRSTTLGQTPFVDRILWGPHTPGALVDALRQLELRPRSEPDNDRRRAAEVVDEFLAWQPEAPTPFFAFVNLYDAHDPYVAPPGYDGAFGRTPGKQDLYDAGIRYMDGELRRVLATLAERGVLDQTLVIVTSDHGEQFGEHGLHNHGNSLYLAAVHVPLVVRLPGGTRAGERVGGPVSLTDVAATILDVAGLGGTKLPGRSLLGASPSVVVTETGALDATARRRSPAERGPLASIVSDSFQYMRNGDTTYQMFNVKRDYGEEHDLAGDAVHCSRAVRLDSLLRAVSRVPATPPFPSSRCVPER